MDKVISINLGGRAYQLDEKGYAMLKEYLNTASSRLADDPDRDEIIGDLESAIAEKLNRQVSEYKTVVTADEVEAIIREMGPVEGGNGRQEEAPQDETGGAMPKRKRLFRIREGKMIGGVCMGLSAYFDIDVVLVRIIFIALLFITHGAMVLAYIVMMLVIPKAKTEEQMASAYGELNAQELIRRAKEEFAEFSDKNEWKKWRREFRHKVREQRREWRAMERKRTGYAGSGFFGLLIVAFIIFWIYGLISALSAGVIFGFLLPAAWPLWAVVLGWVFVFILVIDPLSRLSHGDYRPGYHHGGGIFSLLWIVFIAWLVWHFFPGSHQYFREGYEAIQRAFEAIRRG